MKNKEIIERTFLFSDYRIPAAEKWCLKTLMWVTCHTSYHKACVLISKTQALSFGAHNSLVVMWLSFCRL